MPGALPSRSIACPNKIGGVYSRPAAGRVYWGGVGAAWGIFPVAARIGGAIEVARIGSTGAKVGCEKSAGAVRIRGFARLSASVRLMGSWAAAISAFGRCRAGAPLGVARLSGHPVARSGPEIWKISGQSPALSPFLPKGRTPKAKSAPNGSGCAETSRCYPVRRVGVRLILAGKAWAGSIFGLSRPGLESATLGRGVAHVN